MRTKSKNSFAPVLLVGALFIFFILGCGAIQRTLFTSEPVTVLVTNTPTAGLLPVVTNTIPLLTPNPATVRIVQDTGNALGPYGTAAAGLVTGFLSLYAAWRNRRALAQHVIDKHTG